jgi:prepilin-type N-terminal cleavage/methylation domain-containing protein/prepilin-type processing-associated H-X9-DG protein
MKKRQLKPGFTLVELLVVIGIIAVLIGILLPTLATARRTANSLKCKAALREIGTAFVMYGQEYKGVYPVAVHAAGLTGTPVPIDVERRWYDLIAKYISWKGKGFTTYADITKIRANSLLWGCPEWSRIPYSLQTGDDLRPGYAMQYGPGDYYANAAAGMPIPEVFRKDYAYINSSNGGRGLYVKGIRFTKRGSERGLIVDSMTHIVNVPGYDKYDYSAVQSGGWQPAASDIYTNGGLAFYVDASRHLKPGTKVNDRMQGMNMLFCDNHVTSVSVREAWAAITMKRPPG